MIGLGNAERIPSFGYDCNQANASFLDLVPQKRHDLRVDDYTSKLDKETYCFVKLKTWELKENV